MLLGTGLRLRGGLTRDGSTGQRGPTLAAIIILGTVVAAIGLIALLLNLD
jgi:hypothetical protein